MASLSRRKERGNRYQLHYVDVDGTRFRIDTGTADKKIAELWLKKTEDLLSQAKLGIIPKVGRIDIGAVAGRKAEAKSSLSLEEFKEKYEHRCRNDIELSASSISNNNLAFRALISVVGNKGLAELTDEDIVSWKTVMLRQEKSRTTVAIYFRHLRAAFNRAVKWNLLSSNPFLLVQETKDKQQKGQSKDMAYEEVRVLLKGIEKVGNIQFGNYIRFLLYTGCRRTEVLYLKWEDIDLEGRKMKIFAEKTNRELEIPISKALMQVIEGMEGKKEGYVFQTHSTRRGANKKEKPWHKDFPSHHFKAYIKALGLPEHYTLHSLRHTYTNYLLQRGVPLDIVQKLLGHSSVRTTADNYDHTLPLHFRAQADLVDFEQDQA